MAVEITTRTLSLKAGMKAFWPMRMFCSLLLAGSLQAQKAPATPPKEAPKDSPAQQFPYPGDPAPATSPPTPAPAAKPPDAPSPSSTRGSNAASDAAKQFPYPGEPKLPEEIKPASGASSSGGSSSSSPDSTNDPDNPALPPDPDSPTKPTGRHKLPKVRVLQSDEDREAEDVSIARYYGSTGNWNAAYLRSKDAVRIKPDDPDARLLLAESAHKLNKRDEAVAEYNALLKLDASDDQVRAAHKALARLQ